MILTQFTHPDNILSLSQEERGNRRSSRNIYSHTGKKRRQIQVYLYLVFHKLTEESDTVGSTILVIKINKTSDIIISTILLLQLHPPAYFHVLSKIGDSVRSITIFFYKYRKQPTQLYPQFWYINKASIRNNGIHNSTFTAISTSVVSHAELGMRFSSIHNSCFTNIESS